MFKWIKRFFDPENTTPIQGLTSLGLDKAERALLLSQNNYKFAEAGVTYNKKRISRVKATLVDKNSNKEK